MDYSCGPTMPLLGVYKSSDVQKIPFSQDISRMTDKEYERYKQWLNSVR